MKLGIGAWQAVDNENRSTARENARVTVWEIAALAGCAVAFVALRFPLYVEPGIGLGWHSDAALLGLMARAITAGDYPLLFWASDYLAPLISLFTAVVGSTILPEVGPLALRITVAIEVLMAMLLFHVTLRRAVGVPASLLGSFWFVAGPGFLFKLTYAPLGHEDALLLSAIIFWYVARTRFVRAHHWLILGFLAGSGVWIHRGTLFVLLPALLLILVDDCRFLRRAEIAVAGAILAAGAVLGYTPAIIGRFGFDQRLYAPEKSPWTVGHLFSRIGDVVTHDFWLLVGADTPVGWIGGIAIAALLVSAVRHFQPSRESWLAAGVVATSFAVFIVSNDVARGAVRYIILTIPILYAFAAGEIVRLGGRWRAVGLLIAGLITVSLYVPRWQQMRAVVAAQLEVHESWGGFDPRPALREIAEGGYTVCYANVWVAHKLEWLSDTGVRFVPYRSVNRRMVESLRLGALPGQKCFVDRRGGVHALTAEQEMALRVDTLWGMHGWRRPGNPVPW
ncbi:MAG TPA: hypothetical protein VF701_17515 [Thermoanaerobaculia bacterium]